MPSIRPAGQNWHVKDTNPAQWMVLENVAEDIDFGLFNIFIGFTDIFVFFTDADLPQPFILNQNK